MYFSKSSACSKFNKMLQREQQSPLAQTYITWCVFVSLPL